MTDRELRRLSKTELLELLIDMRQQVEVLERELESTREDLKKRDLDVQKAGSIAQASLQLNGVFQAADEAAAQYLENIERMTRARAEEMIADVERKCKAKEAEIASHATRVDSYPEKLYADFPGLKQRLQEMEQNRA